MLFRSEWMPWAGGQGFLLCTFVRFMVGEILRQSLGFDVFGGVDVPVMGRTAFRTGPGLFFMGNCILDLAAGRTGAGSWCVTLDGNEFFSLLRQLIAQEGPEQSIAGV